MKHRLLLRTGERLQGNGGTLFADRLEIDGRSAAVAFQDIRSLEIATRTKAHEWALAGAGIGAGSFLVVLIYSAAVAGALKDWALDEPPVLVAIGTTFVASGAIGGALLGAKTANWETVSLRRSGGSLGEPRRSRLPLLTMSLKWVSLPARGAR